jgi:hypothetical protein
LIALLLALCWATPEPAASAPIDVDATLTEARALFDQLDYRAAIDKASAVRAATSSAPAQVKQHIAALFLLGYGYAVTDRVNQARPCFAEIVSLDVDAKPDFPMEPQVELILTAARDERVKQLAGEREAARAVLADSLGLVVHPPLNLIGGQRASYGVDVKATDVVTGMRIDFLRENEKEPYGLPMFRHADGSWHGEIPGIYTRSQSGMNIRWYITVFDKDGELAHIGTRAAPRVLPVLPGSEVALDLKATERFSRVSRFVYALFGVPGIVGAFFLGGIGITVPLFVLADNGGNGGLKDLAGLGIVVVPGVATIVAAGLSTQFLLDDGDYLVPAGAIAASAGVFILGTAIGWVPMFDALYHVHDLDKVGDNGRSALGFTIGAAGLAAGVLSTVLITPIMVGIDNGRSYQEEAADQGAASAAAPAGAAPAGNSASYLPGSSPK